MRPLALLFFMASLIPVQADNNLLQNGDFSNGITHWNGNVQTPVAAEIPEVTSGAIIKLRHHDWTLVHQSFRIKAGNYILKVVFMPSSDFHFSNQYPDYMNLKAKLDYPDPNVSPDAEIGQWAIVITDFSAATSIYWTTDLVKPPSQQSQTFSIKGIDFTHEQALTIAFPPGSGYITLQQISLVPAGSP